MTHKCPTCVVMELTVEAYADKSMTPQFTNLFFPDLSVLSMAIEKYSQWWFQNILSWACFTIYFGI